MPVYTVRYVREKLSDDNPLPIMTSKNAYDYLMKYCFKSEDMWKESLFAVFLNSKNIPIGHTCLSTGTLNCTGLDKNLVLRYAIDSGAEGVIVSHNHPSGDPCPGQTDIKQTDALKTALSAFSIHLLDHVIVTDNEFFSFRDEKMTKTV